jgi:hypothetical protein
MSELRNLKTVASDISGELDTLDTDTRSISRQDNLATRLQTFLADNFPTAVLDQNLSNRSSGYRFTYNGLNTEVETLSADCILRYIRRGIESGGRV